MSEEKSREESPEDGKTDRNDEALKIAGVELIGYLQKEYHLEE